MQKVLLFLDFPGDPVLNNSPVNERDMVQSLVWEDTTCHGATKPVRRNYWAHVPRACAPQQEKPLKWRAHARQPEYLPLAATTEKRA